MNEHKYDHLLGIETTGTQDWSLHLAQYHPYEATPYQALDALFHEYEWTNKDRLVDYGCGKGRLLFYLHHRFGLSGTGIEVNKKRCDEAETNLLRYREKKAGIPLIFNLNVVQQKPIRWIREITVFIFLIRLLSIFLKKS